MPDNSRSYIRGAFNGAQDAENDLGKRPVIFDIVAPDRTTSLLPEDFKMVLYVNPSTLQLNWTKQTERTRTRGGFVEFHWGDGLNDMTFNAASGGFVRLYTGLSSVTGGGSGTQGRRQTLAYQKFLDLLALFHNNGALYDRNGLVAMQGYIKVTFDEGVYTGWFGSDLTVTESAGKPYQFDLSGKFTIDDTILNLRTTNFSDQTGTVISPANTPEMTVSQITPEVGDL